MATAVAPTDTLDQKRLLKVLSDYRRGDFSPRMPGDRTGVAGKICDALNEAIERNEKLVKELERLSNVVGKAGNIKQRAVDAERRRAMGEPPSSRSIRWCRTWCSRRPRWRASSARSPRATCRRAWRSRSTVGR